jgi:hypothetical protein
MKIILSEKQLDLLRSDIPENEEIDEIEDPIADPTPSSSSSSTSSTSSSNTPIGSEKASSYPTVGKWESGVTRGPGNQIELTKWSDIVGSTISRGKANPLIATEQIIGTITPPTNPYIDPKKLEELRIEKEKEKNFNDNFFIIQVPDTNAYNSDTVIIPKSVNGIKTSYGVFKHPISPMTFFKDWYNTQWESYIPSESQLNDILPQGSLRWVMVDGNRYSATVIRVNDNPVQWKFNWYHNENDQPYNQYDYVRKDQIPKSAMKKDKTWWDKWGQWLMMGASLLVSIVVPGAAGIWLAVGIDLAAATDILIREGDTIGAAMFAILAFVPVIGNAMKWGRVSTETANRLAKEFAPLKTEDEIIAKMNSLPAKDKYLIQQILKEDPKRIAQMIDSVLSKKITNKAHALKVSQTINDAIKSGQISKKTGYAWYKKLGMRRFGYEISTTGFIIAAGMGAKIYLSKRDNELIKKGLKPSQDGVDVGNLFIKINDQNPEDYENKLVPIIEKYGELYGETNEKKFYEIQKTVANEYLKNPNQDFNKIADSIDRK